MITFILFAGIVLIAINLFKRPNLVFLVWGLLYSITILGTAYYFKSSFTLGRYTVNANDIVTMLFAFAIIRRWEVLVQKFRTNPLVRLLLLTFTLNILLFVIELIFGNHSLESLYNLSRGYIDIPLFFSYFLLFDYDEKKLSQYKDSLVVLSVVISVFFWIVTVLALAGKLNSFQNDRAVSAFISFFPCIASVFLFSKYAANTASRKEILILIFLLISTLFMRHRSLWLGCLAGLFVVLFQYRARIPQMILLALSGMMISFCLYLVFPSVGSRIVDKFLESSVALTEKEGFDKSTGAFRMARWMSRLETNFDARVLFFGQGHGYKRTSSINFNHRKSENSTSFHNQYLEQAFRTGLISILMLLVAMVSLYKANKRTLPEDEATCFNAMYACILVYGMAYSFQSMFYIIVGINLSYLILTGKQSINNDNENSSDHSNIQPAARVKRLALDAWKHGHA